MKTSFLLLPYIIKKYQKNQNISRKDVTQTLFFPVVLSSNGMFCYLAVYFAGGDESISYAYIAVLGILSYNPSTTKNVLRQDPEPGPELQVQPRRCWGFRGRGSLHHQCGPSSLLQRISLSFCQARKRGIPHRHPHQGPPPCCHQPFPFPAR